MAEGKNIEAAQDDATEDEVAEELPTKPPEFVQLPLGSVLSEKQALEMAANRPVQIIVLSGPVGCGKTTFLTSLYELFQNGPLKQIRFAGCQTLPAFEQRCHLSRSESGKEKPDTLRTSYEELQPEYLHLKLQADPADADHLDFLFTDVSGEMFEHARNSTDECKLLKFLRRASHFLVFLDCEKALSSEKKWDMVQEAKSLFQSCLDSEMLGSTCSCTVVWSKCDHIEASKGKKDAMEFQRIVEEDLCATFGDRIADLKFHRTAARPTRFPNLKMGYGVRELLNDWIRTAQETKTMRIDPPQENAGIRESEKFAVRQNGEEPEA